jgi:hypothetical protein
VLPDNGKLTLASMKMVEAISARLNTLSWIWGGLTADVHVGRWLRPHHDLDYLTLNLHSLAPQAIKLFEDAGWQVQRLSTGDLELNHHGIHVRLGHVELAGQAKWTHNGEQGYLCFPAGWLSPEPVQFCGVELHVVEPAFQYVMLEHPEMLNPAWKPRDKDRIAKTQLQAILESARIDAGSLYQQVTAGP